MKYLKIYKRKLTYRFIILFFCISFSLSSIAQNKKTSCKQPNILIVVADDQSFPHTGIYGSNWIKTAAFDRIAREGILFTNAYTPNAKSAPSRACMLTGRNPWQLEEAANHVSYFPLKFKSYAEALRDHGYFVGYTAKGWAPGVAVNKDGSRRTLLGKQYNKFTTSPPTTKISKNNYARNFEDFLDDNSDEKPFCFWYGSEEPHRAYEYGSGIAKGGMDTQSINKMFKFWPDNDTIKTDLLDYAFEIQHFDNHLGEMLQLLEERNLLENTIIVVTSDNGMPFPRIKGQAYEYSNHLPLAIMWKNGIINPGRVFDQFVSVTDFAPTFLDVAGLPFESSGMKPFEGQSLVDVFKNKNDLTVREYMVIGKERHDVGRPNDVGYPIRGIISEGFLYLNNFEPYRWPTGDPICGYLDCDGSPTKTIILNDRRRNGYSKEWNLCFGKRNDEELYMISEDPECMLNLVDSVKFTQIKNSLKQLLYEELKKEGDPRILGNGDIFDKYPFAKDSMRNFYNRYILGEKIMAGWINESDKETDPSVK